MKKKLIVLALVIIIFSEIVCITGLCLCNGQEDKIPTDISIREVPEQTVLYTIYRGQYLKISSAISELYALAKEKGILTCGPVSTCYLNSPVSEQDEHRIIEIQIPVASEAIEQAGTLGPMTDVKKVSAMKVAVAVKPQGCEDPTDLIMDLFSWINKKGYVVKGRMSQSILEGATGHYDMLTTEFAIPVSELNYREYFTLTMDPCYM